MSEVQEEERKGMYTHKVSYLTNAHIPCYSIAEDSITRLITLCGQGVTMVSKVYSKG